jgi:general secretion pathway protein E
MKDLGVAPFLLASSLIGVMAQRLLRQVCPRCGAETTLTTDQLAALRVPLPLLPGGIRLLQGAGCVHCRQTGLFSRTGVFEMLDVNSEIRDLINRGVQLSDLQEAAKRAGMRTLREAAVRKLARGLTSFEEVMRTTAAQ